MTLPPTALLGQYVPPMRGVPFEGPGGVALKTFGRPAIGLDLRHFFIPILPFLIELSCLFLRCADIQTSIPVSGIYSVELACSQYPFQW